MIVLNNLLFVVLVVLETTTTTRTNSFCISSHRHHHMTSGSSTSRRRRQSSNNSSNNNNRFIRIKELERERRRTITTTKQQICSSSSSSTTTTDDVPNNNNNSKFLNNLLKRFQGDFDNYNQVVDDRSKKLLPREGGGHEHIHCTLVPILSDGKNNLILASFYFDGIPNKIFRLRLYKLYDFVKNVDDNESSDENKHVVVRMKLYTLNQKLEEQIRQNADNPMIWSKIFNDYIVDSIGSTTTEKEEEEEEESNHQIIIRGGNELKNCDVEWSTTYDPNQHTYLVKNEKGNEDNNNNNNNDGGYHGIMVYGEAIVESTIVPGMMIRIVDQLSIWGNDNDNNEDTEENGHDGGMFYIHDRGFDPTSGEYIYGNQNNIPYHLQRVTNIITSTSNSSNSKNEQNEKQLIQERIIINNNLQWTLGSKYYTTNDEYIQKMNQIGGISSQLNK